MIARTVRGAWPSLPALLVASAALCAAATVPVVAAPGVNAVAVALYAVCATPFGAALAAVANTIAFGEVATIREWAVALRRHAGFAIRHGLVTAAAAELLLATLVLWSRGHQWWLLPSLALTGTATVLTGLGLLAVLPLGVARPALRGVRLWLTALHLVARRPSRFVAVCCVVGLGLLAATNWSASVLLLVPAPAVIVLVAAVWTTAADVAQQGAVVTTI